MLLSEAVATILVRDDGSWEYLSDDRFGTLSDGSRIRLKPDGSWEIEPAKKSFITIPAEALKRSEDTVRTDKLYLETLENKLPEIIDKFEPEFIYYLSGVDIMQNDKLGKLALTLDGCKERDRIVLNLCKLNSIPVQISMGGGYSPDISVIVEAHANTFRLAQEIYF